MSLKIRVFVLFRYNFFLPKFRLENVSLYLAVTANSPKCDFLQLFHNKNVLAKNQKENEINPRPLNDVPVRDPQLRSSFRGSCKSMIKSNLVSSNSMQLNDFYFVMNKIRLNYKRTITLLLWVVSVMFSWYTCTSNYFFCFQLLMTEIDVDHSKTLDRNELYRFPGPSKSPPFWGKPTCNPNAFFLGCWGVSVSVRQANSTSRQYISDCTIGNALSIDKFMKILLIKFCHDLTD